MECNFKSSPVKYEKELEQERLAGRPKETDFCGDLDGSGKCIEATDQFLDHMIQQLSSHGLFDIEVELMEIHI